MSDKLFQIKKWGRKNTFVFSVPFFDLMDKYGIKKPYYIGEERGNSYFKKNINFF